MKVPLEPRRCPVVVPLLSPAPEVGEREIAAPEARPPTGAPADVDGFTVEWQLPGPLGEL